MTDDLMHYGTPRHSGRYPWGSGGQPQNSRDFLSYVEDLRKKGLSEVEIAKGLDITTTQLRARKSIAKNEFRKDQQTQALRLKDKGMSNVAIGERMGIGESQVRQLLNPAMQERADILKTTSNMLKDQVSQKGLIDIGEGVENHIGISREKLNTAVAVLKEEGYSVYYVKTKQLGTGHETTVKVLAPPGVGYPEVAKNKGKIDTVNNYTEDGGRTFLGIEPPTSVSSSRVAVRYAEDGGSAMDGVVLLRPGVQDISLGKSNYAQVRIAVDDTHFIKGMAMYSDKLPDGVDLLFNTNKSNTGNKMDALKPLKDEDDNPFGAVVRQRHFLDAAGKNQLSPINIVNEEGDWGEWSRTLSSQMLSKQAPVLAKRQLDFSFAQKQSEFDEIMALTNPAVKQKLLQSFSDGCDSASVHLKAAALPRQRSQVILPFESLKDGEIYAPNFRNGERVALIRHPHGGKFEIPELTVNNNNVEAKGAIGNALDAVGINSKVAQRLSGADFDGDTVIVIPNNNRTVQSSAPLKGLKNFDPVAAYQDKSLPKMKDSTKQREMGNVSNLITDMTIKGASDSEIARAVRHSMVVIDAEKHQLDYKRSFQDNGIAQLKEKYQRGARSGASTLVSQASSEARVLAKKLRTAAEGGPIDPKTGKLVYTKTGETYVNKRGQVKDKLVKSTKMLEVDDAFELSSGTTMETVYAVHANRLKALGNQARLELLKTKPSDWSPSAKTTYASEVASLNAKLNLAKKNKPLERRAQLLANAVVDAKKKANPDLTPADIKKLGQQALQEQRNRAGAGKPLIDISDSEWSAIQAGAISHSKLKQILDNSDLDRVKALATPRVKRAVSPAVLARAKTMLASGYTQAEVADHLGIPLSTLNDAVRS